MRLVFTAPPAGLAPLIEFDFEAVEDASGLHTLVSVDCPEVRLFLIDPVLYLPGYRPHLPAGQRGRVLVIARSQSMGTTVNLLAPLVVDEFAGSCSQVILDGPYPVSAQLMAA